MRTTEPPKSSTIKQLCERHNFSEVTAWRLIKSGELRAVKIGRLTRILHEDEQDFLASRRPVRAA